MVIRLLAVAALLSMTGCGLETLLGDAASGGQFVEYVPEPQVPQTLNVRVSDRPGQAVVLGEFSATADAFGWASLTVPHDVNLRFAVVDSGPLTALVPPGATSIAMDDRTTADVRFLRALGGDLQSADGVGLMNLLNDARSDGRGYYRSVTRELMGLTYLDDDYLGGLTAGRAITPCVDDDHIRVVFQVEMSDGMRDGNCAPIDRFRWATDISDASMFITGGVHEKFEATDPVDALAAHDALGGWLPNVVPMKDAGDGRWTYVVDLPRATPPLQLGYKFTWGLKGSTWTGTEEWPGNQRLLEVVDVDGDGLVVVRDRFGDEASNKDRQNLRRGGLGAIDYTDAAAREHAVDDDGDCVGDAFPSAGSVTPLLGDCSDPGAPAPAIPAGDTVVVSEVRGRFGNGGGGIAEVLGEGFAGGQGVTLGGKPATAIFVRSPTTLLAVTPELPPGPATVEVGGRLGPDLSVNGPGGAASAADAACRLYDSGGLSIADGPLSASGYGTEVTVVGRVSSNLVARMELGMGPGGSDPEANDQWSFWPARYSGPVEVEDGTESEYAAELAIPGTGFWSYGFRLSGDGGFTWRYCDGFGNFFVDGGE